jgi:hypothetical protein
MSAYHCHIFHFLINNPTSHHEIIPKMLVDAKGGRFLDLTSFFDGKVRVVKRQQFKLS